MATFRNEVLTDFGHRPRATQVARGNKREVWIALAIGIAVFVTSLQLTTQWVAHRLHYQQALGAPVVRSEPPVYPPWKAYQWRARLARSDEAKPFAESVGSALNLAPLLSLVAAALVFSSNKRRQSNRVHETHGSARRAAKEDIEQTGLFAEHGLVLGTWTDAAGNKRLLRHDGPDNVLIFAVMGGGKGVGNVLPSLYTWKHSAIVLDIKAENHAFTSGYRHAAGQRVFRVNLALPSHDTARINVLDFIRFGTDQEEADLQRIATARVDSTGALRKSHTDGSHWLSTGIAFLAAAILHSVYREGGPLPDGRSPVGLADVLADLTDPRKAFEDLVKEWLVYAHDDTPLPRWRDADGMPTRTHPIVSAVARVQLGRSPNERSAIMSTVVTALEVFRDPLLAANTATSDFLPSDIMDADAPTTVYLQVRPTDLPRLAPIANLFLDLTLRRLTETMAFDGGRESGSHKHDLLLMLDELPALGRVPILAEALGYFRGWGIKAMIVVQNLKQLQEHYGQNESISGLCGVTVAYPPTKVDVDTAKHISAMCGTTTVIRRSPPASGGRLNETVTEQEVARPLLLPDEVSCMRGPRREGKDIVEPGDVLVFATGCQPIFAEQFLFFKDRTMLLHSKLEPSPAVPVGHPKPQRPQRRRRASVTAPAVVQNASEGADLLTAAGTEPDPPDFSLDDLR
ncbi:MAG TPA: type IV secretory system conjugative DNA transfer family protein [Polyangiales bacterium]|nr:type IV secretory system conjugative DNA transfer family protein [Polyangiales bacterium]